MTPWQLFTGSAAPHDGITRLPSAPTWRRFTAPDDHVESLPSAAEPPDPRFRIDPREPGLIDMVNAALYLRRPLLVTGKPGSGKSTLIRAVAHELRLGPVLTWPVTSRATLKDGLYQYDALGRLQAHRPGEPEPDIGQFIELGPLGTALLPFRQPRALLIDEIDKSDIDLPNDLLNVFEKGEFSLPELQRYAKPTVQVRRHENEAMATVTNGRVVCREFPFVVLTSNGEREFPAPFLRRCLRYTMPEPDEAMLGDIVEAHLGAGTREAAAGLIHEFFTRRQSVDLATDQLLNAVHLVSNAASATDADRQRLVDALLQQLSTS